MSAENSVPAISRRAALLGTAAVIAARGAAAQSDSRSTPEERSRFPRASAAAGRGLDVERFVDDCRRAHETADAQAAVREVLARAIADPGAVLRGVGEPEKGGIETLHRSASLTVLNIVWAPLMQLMPHEHDMWSVIGIYTGREDNIFWQRASGTIEAVGAEAISPGRAVPLARDVIHSVANPIGKLTGAIHIYGGDFFAVPRSEWDPETLRERDWDIERAVEIFEQSNERFFSWNPGRECA